MPDMKHAKRIGNAYVVGIQGRPDDVPEILRLFSSKTLNEIESLLHYTFNDKQLLALAFIHSSFANERNQTWIHRVRYNPLLPNNERLEFLGDSILQTVSSDILYNLLPNHSEGELTELRTYIVGFSVCTHYALKLGIDKYILVGNGDEYAREGRRSILADLFEAVMGAIFLDGGMEAAKEFFLHNFETDICDIINSPKYNYKKALQEYCAKTLQGSLPVYECQEQTLTESGRKSVIFNVTVSVCGDIIGEGAGKNKQNAEQEAAGRALSHISASYNSQCTTVVDQKQPELLDVVLDVAEVTKVTEINKELLKPAILRAHCSQLKQEDVTLVVDLPDDDGDCREWDGNLELIRFGNAEELGEDSERTGQDEGSSFMIGESIEQPIKTNDDEISSCWSVDSQNLVQNAMELGIARSGSTRPIPSLPISIAESLDGSELDTLTDDVKDGSDTLEPAGRSGCFPISSGRFSVQNSDFSSTERLHSDDTDPEQLVAEAEEYGLTRSGAFPIFEDQFLRSHDTEASFTASQKRLVEEAEQYGIGRSGSSQSGPTPIYSGGTPSAQSSQRKRPAEDMTLGARVVEEATTRKKRRAGWRIQKKKLAQQQEH